jgi:hypothetical protein
VALGPQEVALRSTADEAVEVAGNSAMDSVLDAVQWPAMIATLAAAWLIASEGKRRRSWGFWCFVVSNVLWIVWGWHDGAYALMGLQAGLFALNVRGLKKTESEST